MKVIGQRVCLRKPASAGVYAERGKTSFTRLEAGTLVEVLRYHDGNRLADVLVEGKILLMCVQDIQELSKLSANFVGRKMRIQRFAASARLSAASDHLSASRFASSRWSVSTC
jgi:hypothetical protein